MSARIDHFILPVNQAAAAFEFYCGLLGFERDGMHGPFDVVRVAPDFVLLVTEFQTQGGLHLAFTFDEARFHSVFEQIKGRGISYGDQFDQIGNLRGPSPQPGASGEELGIYLPDPSRHLIELRSERA